MGALGPKIRNQTLYLVSGIQNSGSGIFFLIFFLRAQFPFGQLLSYIHETRKFCHSLIRKKTLFMGGRILIQ